jgi:fructose-bisphosphate aldolase class I
LCNCYIANSGPPYAVEIYDQPAASTTGSYNISNNTFINVSNAATGGAIYCKDTSQVSITGNAFRLITSSNHAILFEGTMDRSIDGVGSAEYLWSRKQVIAILKVDKGLADEADGVQLMKPMPELDALLAKARANGIFGTKMRSVIKVANAKGISEVVAQQFAVGRQILAGGLVPIIEPEVDINSPSKKEAEVLLKAALLKELDVQPADQPVMLKLTLPEDDNFYLDLVKHPSVLRVVALSGGYSRDDANTKLSKNNGVIASFSRALTEGLSAQQSDAEFNASLDNAIASIYAASNT